MNTFKIVNGDIAVRGDGKVVDVSGAKRIEQELSCWILEPLGTDKVYGGFGSTIGEMIGSPSLTEYLDEVRDEVARVVNNYVSYQEGQLDKAKRGSAEAAINSWSDDDVINSVDSIEVKAVADTVQVTVKLTTVAGAAIKVNQVL